jgi:hypothetical protein
MKHLKKCIRVRSSKECLGLDRFYFILKPALKRQSNLSPKRPRLLLAEAPVAFWTEDAAIPTNCPSLTRLACKGRLAQAITRAVSQLLWPDKDREVWFSLGENHEKVYPFGLHQLRNCSSRDARSDLQTQVTLRSSRRRARPAIANQDLTYSTLWNPVSMVTRVPVTLPCT